MNWANKILKGIAAMMIIALTSLTHAQVPESISYQGYLSASDGSPQQDPVVVQFAIYAVETGGTPLWSEFQNIFPDQGLFITSFGNDANPFPLDMFETPLFLGITVGVDNEMVPRTSFKSSAFSLKASDANTLGGLSAAQLDQSSEVSSLTSSLNSTQSDVSALQSGLSTAQSELSVAQADLNDIETDLTTTSVAVTSIENTIPTLQTQVTGSCPSGSSINAVNSSGGVTCELDDAGPWLTSGTTPYLLSGDRVGLGTTAPAASIQIDAPTGTDPFRARIASATKLRVHSNGSVSVGSSSAGVENGLHVFGSTGMGTTSPNAKLEIIDDNWQMGLDNGLLGGDDWYLGSSADAWAIGGGKFVISTTDNSNSHALVINSGKEIGLGTSDPQTRLHVAGGSDVSAASGGYVTVGSITSTNIAIDNNEIMARSNGTAVVLALNAEGGEVTVNANGVQDDDALRVVGRTLFTSGQNSGLRMSATNSSPTNAVFEPTLFEEGLVGQLSRPFWRVYSREFYAQSALEYRTYSDRSVKKNIEPIQDALATIQALEGVSYALTNHPMDPGIKQRSAEEQFVHDNQLGFIAQEVAKVLPQLVTEDESSGLKTVAYMGLIPVLVEALKQQQLQIDEQRIKLDQLERRLGQSE